MTSSEVLNTPNIQHSKDICGIRIVTLIHKYVIILKPSQHLHRTYVLNHKWMEEEPFQQSLGHWFYMRHRCDPQSIGVPILNEVDWGWNDLSNVEFGSVCLACAGTIDGKWRLTRFSNTTASACGKDNIYPIWRLTARTFSIPFPFPSNICGPFASVELL